MDTSIMYAADFEKRIRSGTHNFWTWNILSFLQETSDLQPWIKWGTPIMHATEFEAKDLKQQATHGILGYYAIICELRLQETKRHLMITLTCKKN
jgi:hypothetical protein